MDVENFCSFLDTGKTNLNLSVKATRSEKSRIKTITSVCSRKHNHRRVGLEAVHLHEQLVEGVVTLLVAATHSTATLLANSVDLVNEND